MDECDQAAIFTDRYLQGEIVRATRQINNNGKSLTHCSECGEEIPEERRKAVPGCELCVTCKNKLEKSL